MEIMSKYQRAVQKIEEFIPGAIDKLFAKYGEAVLPLDQNQVVTSIVSRIRLNAGTEPINNKPLMFDAVCRAFIGLYDEGRLTVKFEPSILGEEELRELRGLFPNAARSQPVYEEPERELTDADRLADVINDWKTLPTMILNKKRLDATWRARFDEADNLGLLEAR
jgi:hypothetical protein